MRRLFLMAIFFAMTIQTKQGAASARSIMGSEQILLHMIDQDLCEQCGKCVSSCDEGCIKTATKLPKLPKKKTKCGKW